MLNAQGLDLLHKQWIPGGAYLQPRGVEISTLIMVMILTMITDLSKKVWVTGKTAGNTTSQSSCRVSCGEWDCNSGTERVTGLRFSPKAGKCWHQPRATDSEPQFTPNAKRNSWGQHPAIGSEPSSHQMQKRNGLRRPIWDCHSKHMDSQFWTPLPVFCVHKDRNMANNCEHGNSA